MTFFSSVEVASLPTNVKLISFKVARRIISQHHYLGYAPPGCKFSLGVYVGCDLIGVMIFGHPIARQENQENTLELTRMFLFDSPKNSESRALSLAEKWIRKNRDETRLIAYSDPKAGHQGTIYKAANWRYVGESKSWSWSKSRSNRRGKTGRKLKFERLL